MESLKIFSRPTSARETCLNYMVLDILSRRGLSSGGGQPPRPPVARFARAFVRALRSEQNELMECDGEIIRGPQRNELPGEGGKKGEKGG
jgi:hypothetical protein